MPQKEKGLNFFQKAPKKRQNCGSLLLFLRKFWVKPILGEATYRKQNSKW